MNTTTSNYIKHTQSRGVRRYLIQRFNRKIISIFDSLLTPQPHNPTTPQPRLKVLDAGCGEGFMLDMLYRKHRSLQFQGCDLNKTALDIAKEKLPEINFFLSSIYNIETTELFHIILCSEVLEHLERPEIALMEIRKHICKNGFVILTVPHEPIFRLCNLVSGKYVNRFGNHPEHIQNFGRRAFFDLCSTYFNPVAKTSSFPWTIFVGQAICV
jgi:2-polyprenyl-3-methyl-5-hydroxy-6-metoxy-1,4-benzoquinol methylase